ncbi:Conserved oligomeric Golgi complex subunit 6 [Colletotrichum sp. SAR 10_70]|nr:Conserved oligomeric Golgi complex subunit 6 [Colletotrichum sp. SAR 10_71]KAI8173142.1 Conserved oligomeric Golgi complex subunit 6 [Colletotrichum sp. SAR 10_75]KAI8189196.1 Conserved oligomeric Golgi complex subunit 6 [Colletotrichum sp. SAR 10_70]KAI8194029.1 Conserved oligomeric Golgi complex subunit 6 [Colletotrichum sp. SAR 10_65]KAI8197292.1 Conserved oligomeric Golgi complex subunit 6 [Colletotrichum sp. SAR 10_76]KAI8218053.1 Conserved oligomeric Golgi complex subunit 6 [Colletotr
MANHNPLTSKVTTVLSTSYADSEFRDALQLLDGRGLKNTPETRRQLRLELQKEVIDSNGEIVCQFGRVADQLRRIGATLDKLNNNYQHVRSRITAAHQNTDPILTEASSLIHQRAEVDSKQHILKTLRSHFMLSDHEVASLTSTAEPVDDSFFTTLTKAKRISKDCEILLGFEKQTLGLEIMDQTSKNLNLAFQKLYKWVQREFKTLNLENPQMNSSIRRAIRVLAERPSLFQNCLDFFAEARERILSDSFNLALTGTTDSGVEDHSVKPIEMAAHDPLRYVGDMLAWIHSATVSEREALEILFVSEGDEIAKGLQSGRANELWQLLDDGEGDAAGDYDALKALNDLVDRDVSGATRILRQRVEQVIQSNEETILAYKLANILGFYRFTFTKLLGSQCGLLDLMSGLEAGALRQFRSLMRDHIATLQGDFQQTPSDLGPPDFLLDALKQLTAVMKTYEISLATSSDPKQTLEPFDFTQRRSQQLQEEIERESEKLAEGQYQFFRRGSGLEKILDALSKLTTESSDVGKAASLEVLQPEAMSRASQILDDFLPSALMDAVENVKHLQDSVLARGLTEKAAARFCDDFEHIEQMLLLVDEMAGRDEDADKKLDEHVSLRALFPRTTGEIRVLLS